MMYMGRCKKKNNLNDLTECLNIKSFFMSTGLFIWEFLIGLARGFQNRYFMHLKPAMGVRRMETTEKRGVKWYDKINSIILNFIGTSLLIQSPIQFYNICLEGIAPRHYNEKCSFSRKKNRSQWLLPMTYRTNSPNSAHQIPNEIRRIIGSRNQTFLKTPKLSSIGFKIWWIKKRQISLFRNPLCARMCLFNAWIAMNRSNCPW